MIHMCPASRNPKRCFEVTNSYYCTGKILFALIIITTSLLVYADSHPNFAHAFLSCFRSPAQLRATGSAAVASGSTVIYATGLGLTAIADCRPPNCGPRTGVTIAFMGTGEVAGNSTGFGVSLRHFHCGIGYLRRPLAIGIEESYSPPGPMAAARQYRQYAAVMVWR